MEAKGVKEREGSGGGPEEEWVRARRSGGHEWRCK